MSREQSSGAGSRGDEPRTDGPRADRDREDGSTTDPGFDSSPLRIEVPETVRLDEGFVPRVTGLAPNERATLTARTSDGTREWVSSATFEADEDGTIDLSAAAPVAGSYDRADPAGPRWSMTPVDDEPRHRFDPAPLGSHEISFVVEPTDSGVESAPDDAGVEADADDGTAAEEDGNRRRAAASVTVRHADPGVTRHEVDADGIAGAWFEPAGSGPHPGVLVLHGSNGHPMETSAALLASQGFAAFALQYLGVFDLPDHPVEVPVEYAVDALEWFRGLDATGDACGAYGASMGGQLALLLATVDGGIDAVVSDAGATAVFSSGETAPWTIDGEPHPRIPIREEPPDAWDRTVDGAPIKRDMWLQMLEAADADRRRAATIPLEEADAPILFLSGCDDAVWPATTFGNMALARLDALGYDHRYDHRVFHDAGHVIGYPHRPTTWRPVDEGLANGGDPAAQARAQAESWPRVLGFLHDALS